MAEQQPYKGQNIIYRAIGGIEYAAIITDVRPEGVSLTVLPPQSWTLNLSRIRYLAEWLPTDGDGVCYPPRPAGQDDAVA